MECFAEAVVETIEQPASPRAMEHGEDYAGEDPRGWWMSEKLDGWRAQWDGAGSFWSKGGKRLPAPAELVISMPWGVCLEGELYGGPGSLHGTGGKIRRGEWEGLRFHIFDLVGAGSFEARQDRLGRIRLPEWCQVVEHRRCGGMEDLKRTVQVVRRRGGEGVMLRQAGREHRSGRHRGLLKVKGYFEPLSIFLILPPGRR